MLDAFEASNILYCHWKSNEHLKPALDGDTDLDVLFLPEQRIELEIVLAKCGLKRFSATSLMQYNGIEDYIGFDISTAKIWHLHLHYRMTFGEKHLKGYTVTPWGYKLIENRIYGENGVYTSCPEDELVLLLVRNALKLRWRDNGKKIGGDDIAELNWLYEQIDIDRFKSHVGMYLPEKSVGLVVKLAEKRPTKKNQLKKLQKSLRKALKVFSGYSKCGSFMKRTQRELYWGIGAIKRKAGLNSNMPCRRMSPSGGCVVAFLGCDGAGKSTTIDFVKREFSKKLDIKIVYLGSGYGSSSLLRKPMKLIARKVGGKGVGHAVEKEYSEKRNISFKAKLYGIAKVIWAMTLAREKRNKLHQITKARNNGMLVLVDRYPQTEVSGYSDGPLLSKYLKNGHGLLYSKALKEQKIYQSAKLSPPDLTLKLMVPTEVAIARKPEMTPEEIENKKAAVMKINISPNSVVIDTSVEKNVSFAQVMNEIWKII